MCLRFAGISCLATVCSAHTYECQAWVGARLCAIKPAGLHMQAIQSVPELVWTSCILIQHAQGAEEVGYSFYLPCSSGALTSLHIQTT